MKKLLINSFKHLNFKVLCNFNFQQGHFNFEKIYLSIDVTEIEPCL